MIRFPTSSVRCGKSFGKGPNDRADQYRRALNAFAIKHGSMEETVFRLWFDEQRRLYDKATVA